MFISELLLESTTKHAAFCFGRMNPPTVGHEQLIKTVGREANGGDYFIFVSQTQDSKKNPLDYQQKIRYLRAIYPGMASHFVYEPSLKTIMQVAEWLYNKGYTSVTFVAGSDRLPEFEKLLNAYNGVEGKGAYYKFDNISYASSGERDPDSDGIGGISASMAREAAVKGDFETFSKAVDAGSLTKQMYDAVRAGMGVQDTELAEGRRALPPGWSGKKWRPNIPANKTPKDSPEKTDEGWKGALAGAALIGGIGASMVASNPLTIDGVTYQSSMQGPDSSAESSTAKIITHNGKKYLVWKGTGPKPSHRAWKYKEVKPQQDTESNLGFNKEKWKKPYELEPTDLWVNEDIQPGKMYAFLQSVADFLKKDPSLAGKFRAKDVGMRVWTRGDGTRHRDPAKLSFENEELRDHAFELLKKALSGAKQTSVTGEFGSSPAQEALVWKGKVFHKYGDFSIALGTASRITNKNSVWKEKPTVESIQAEIKRLTDYVANRSNGGGAGLLEAINTLKNKLASLNEMFGPMGGDQRNMRGSQPRIEEPAGFSGSLTVSYPNFKNYALASKYNVQVSDSGGSEKNLTITGNKKNIKQFLVASGWNSSDLRNWYPELHENDNDSWAVEINGEVVPAHNQDHAMNKARNALSYKKADVVYILHNGKKVYSWKLGEKIQQLAECSGYIPKNAKEAKDPRWSNALSVDVGIDTPAKNLKAFGL